MPQKEVVQPLRLMGCHEGKVSFLGMQSPQRAAGGGVSAANWVRDKLIGSWVRWLHDGSNVCRMKPALQCGKMLR
ncbi:hypothetical protein CTI12_AA552790 [Artemisia annua]|uniref:Uncharacterized protein n=1 Tax=Artemisia annua TaxID=35608 RepID=A0A2U1KSB2_ARTAN|nr:hypothetical protein CTI12_AA552790 [Artemisia annua]